MSEDFWEEGGMRRCETCKEIASETKVFKESGEIICFGCWMEGVAEDAKHECGSQPKGEK